MPRRSVPLLAAALVAGTGLAAAAAVATAAPVRLAIPGGAATALTGGHLGPVSTAAHLPVDVVLASRDLAGQDALIAAGQALTPAQYAARFAPTRAQVELVTGWAQAAGLSVTALDGGQVLALDGTARAVGAAFGTTVHTLTVGSHTGLALATTASAPAPVARLIAGVTGLTEIGALQTASRTAVRYLASYTPQQISAIYRAGPTNTGTGVPVAVIASGPLGQVQTDLRTFERTFRLRQVPWQTIATGAAGTDASGQDEYDLDTQYATSQAPSTSKLYVYDGSGLSNAAVLTEIATWAHQRLTRQASFSAGECEVLAEATGFEASLDTVLRQAAVQGQTLFTSSGDTGSFCPAPVVGVNGVPAGLPGPNYPAASPYAIGVGGTTVLDPTTPTEIAWYGSGGGPSLFEAVPGWQKAAGGTFAGVRRGVPDVALDADPESGYDVVVSGAVVGIGGTSAGAPAWQGFWARAQSGHRGRLAFAGPILYAVPATTFHDIVVGTTGLYPAGPGYDYPTGRGTPIVPLLTSRA